MQKIFFFMIFQSFYINFIYIFHEFRFIFVEIIETLNSKTIQAVIMMLNVNVQINAGDVIYDVEWEISLL